MIQRKLLMCDPFAMLKHTRLIVSNPKKAEKLFIE